MPSVSERTIYRRMERYGLRALDFYNISDVELDRHVMESRKARKIFLFVEYKYFFTKKEAPKYKRV